MISIFLYISLNCVPIVITVRYPQKHLKMGNNDANLSPECPFSIFPSAVSQYGYTISGQGHLFGGVAILMVDWDFKNHFL